VFQRAIPENPKVRKAFQANGLRINREFCGGIFFPSQARNP
jgi:hypothetical protein